MEETTTDDKELPGVDRETKLQLVPEAGSDKRAQTSTPPDVRGVGPKVQVGRHLTEGHPETAEAGGATTADLEGSPGTKPQESTGPPDPKTDEGKAEETSCEVSLQGRGEPWRKASPAERVKQLWEASQRTEILRRLIQAWRRDPATEKPQKTGH